MSFHMSFVMPTAYARRRPKEAMLIMTPTAALTEERLARVLAPEPGDVENLRSWFRMTQSEIAAEVGISQMHVSRLLTKSLATLREGLADVD